jgi:hypothetical protein
MNNTVCFSLGLMFFSSFAQSTPWGLPGNAVIASEHGELSICVPQKKSENVKIKSISVSENQPLSGDRLTMWELELEQTGEGMVLKPGGCILYGASPSGYQSTVTAKSLGVGHVYYARVNINVANPTRQSILFYDAVFCVAQKKDDGLVYLQYIYDKDGNEVRHSLCPVLNEVR